MADETDNSQRTEEATQKRLQDAYERGEGPRSHDVVLFATLSAATFAVIIWGGQVGHKFVERFTDFLARPEMLDTSGQGLMALAWNSAYALGLILGLPFALMVAAAIGSNLVQAPLVFLGERLKIDITKLSPGNGLSRLFGGEAWVNFARGLAKVGLAGAAGVWAAWPDHDRLLALIGSDPAAAGPAALAMLTRVLVAMLVVIALIAGLDWFWQRFSFQRRMRMSRQEIRDELKQSEGDPLVRMKIRQIRMERGRKRMMAAVPTATVIVTNPTHYAVALKYESGEMSAPRCVAKGVDALALRIRAMGEEHKVPVIENPPLARALYAAVDVDADIPIEHYKAVAQIIGFIMRQRSRS